MSEHRVDVAVYGGTPAGIAAAVAAARRGAQVLLVEPSGHVGGLNAGGINTAESEHMLPASFGGLALEFYRRVGASYGHDSPLFHWEPHVAEAIFHGLLDEAGVGCRQSGAVDSVERGEGRIRRISLTDGGSVAASVFIDASYEGDLMARAGVTYTYGRESRAQYGESLAGVRYVERPEEVAAYASGPATDLLIDVPPYNEDGSLLPGFTAPEEVVPGAGDRKVMNYHFRVNVSDSSDRVPIDAPPGYDPERFRLLGVYLRRRPNTTLRDLIDFYPFPSGRYSVRDDGGTTPHPGAKWELNNRQNAVISLGHFGGQFDYPDGDYATRQRIWDDHRAYNQGLLYYLGHDPAVPPPLRAEMGRWGLPADEFVENGHWPYALYVREARRMLGATVFTEHDILDAQRKPDMIAVGSHWIDCHHVQRVAVSRVQFRNEGRIWVEVRAPFAIPYRCITPRRQECANLLVPVCVSASHVGFCSLRVESTWMALGHAAGVAAALALEGGLAVQDIATGRLQQALQAGGVALDL